MRTPHSRSACARLAGRFRKSAFGERAFHASVLIALSILLYLPQRALADARGETQQAFLIPPPPSKAEPKWAFDVHANISLALNTRSLCPRGVGCVFQGGGGIGGSVERRWPKGYGVFGAYDVWFVNSDSVYELGVQQAFHGGLRYTMPTDVIFHPVFDLSVGVMGYGDTFNIATVGALGQVFAGAEIELSPTVGLRLGLGMRAFSHSTFRTERDQIQRGAAGVFAESAFFAAGLTIM